MAARQHDRRHVVTLVDHEQRERFDTLLGTTRPASATDDDLRVKLLRDVNAIVEREGAFTALVAIFGNVDRGGDRIVRGAFAKSLDAWRESGNRIPIVWSHQYDHPAMVIGSADPMQSKETDEGLLLVGQLNLDSPVAHHVRDLLRNGDINGWSFGYKTIRERKAADGANELLEVEIGEAGPCIIPMNAATRTVTVKGEQPEPQPERVPSHAELEQRLAAEGIVVIDDAIFTEARDHMRAMLNARRNGDEERDEDKSTRPRTKAAGPIRVISFDC